MGLTLVDSSVWIDLLANRDTRQTRALTQSLDRGDPLGIGDLVLMEVLQGARSERSAQDAIRLFEGFDPVQISDHRVAVQAARNYRHLRSLGITIRKTIDTLIATRCILDRLPLLYSDRDFDPFVQHLGLRPALATPE
ncbi:VapC toxin family PIN domain ribonuclease [Arthrobacter sp. TPD3018]|uniref:type II toxin-antitoxin system VapC family toxin n=1 Tax=Bacteria TaxID=2 RepID=UPI000D51D1D3|nr:MULTISPECIES: PIN domain nuclease [Bacteria]PVE53535.1 VapC toxin family PIN domain ribonuclease [Sphingomonas sp. TPD3009]PVE56029.1 VapC toxin family PIN domain ribonuclease [Arthrobacter sp. TPD3018]PVE81627.1 VapC toxin family PIN domain ribonuclease [Sphingomonas melonis]